MADSPRILLIGAGAVGATLAAWLAPVCDEFYVLDQGATQQALKSQGVTAYWQDDKAHTLRSPVKTIDHFSEIAAPDYILLCVKNYSLAALSEQILAHYGDQPVIVGLQNGIANQSILPHYFSRVVYGVICYNAWLDQPAVAGYQKHGPLVLGALDSRVEPAMQRLAQVLSRGVPTVITPHLNDAVLSKMIINLTNSFTTLVGLGWNGTQLDDLDDARAFQTILTRMTYEGVQIVKAAGHRECKLGGMPSWRLMHFAAHAPHWLTRPLFRKNVAKMVISSMAQDVIQNRRGDNELDSINGYLLDLARKHGVAAPYNQAIFALCQAEFARPDFTPLKVSQVWQAIQTAPNNVLLNQPARHNAA